MINFFRDNWIGILVYTVLFFCVMRFERWTIKQQIKSMKTVKEEMSVADVALNVAIDHIIQKL